MVSKESLEVRNGLQRPLFLCEQEGQVEERPPEVRPHGYGLLEPVLSLPGVALRKVNSCAVTLISRDLPHNLKKDCSFTIFWVN